MTELNTAVREAQADADRRFGVGPVQPWEPRSSALGAAARRRLVILASVALLALVLLLVVVMDQARSAAEPLPEHARPETTLPLPGTTAETDEPDSDDFDAASAGHALPPVRSTEPILELVRHGLQWQLHADGASRLALARRLAEASGSSVHGAIEALGESAPVRVRWQGSSLAQAWPQVLGPDLSYAMRCRRDRCEIWIAGRIAPPAAPTGAFPDHSLARAHSAGEMTRDIDDTEASDDEAGR